MTEKNLGEDLDYEQKIFTPRGTDVTKQYQATTTISTETAVATLTATSGKVLYIRGVNYIDRANISTIKLYLDGSSTAIRQLYKPPGSSVQMNEIDCYRPPLRAVTNAILKVTDDGTAITNFRSLICAYEADQ